MNPQRGGTTNNSGLMLWIQPRGKHNTAIQIVYNNTRDNQQWKSASPNNQSETYKENYFLKQSKIFGDKEQVLLSHSFAAVIVISSMFLFFTIAITAALMVFCRKRNTVFAIQKCEQEDEDNEYEMDDINTDVEYTSEYESDTDNSRSFCRPSPHTLDVMNSESPPYQPLKTTCMTKSYEQKFT